jgi:hypothetical protein
MTTPTLNLKGDIKITEGSLTLEDGDVTVTGGDLHVAGGKIYVGDVEIAGAGLTPDEDGNLELGGNLTIKSSKTLTIGSIVISIKNDHLAIGGVEIWAS